MRPQSKPLGKYIITMLFVGFFFVLLFDWYSLFFGLIIYSIYTTGVITAYWIYSRAEVRSFQAKKRKNLPHKQK